LALIVSHHHGLDWGESSGSGALGAVLAQGLYLLVALLWFVPDRRIEHALVRK